MNFLSRLARHRSGSESERKPPNPAPVEDRPLPASRGYCICTLPRSGSNVFCDVLSQVGLLGRPREYFNTGARRMYDDPAYPEDPAGQIARILTTGATPNGVYALKLFPGLFDRVSPHLKLTDVLPRLHFVRLRRRDVLGQAISWVRSIQSQQFRSTEVVQGTIRYDAEAIRSYVGQVCQRNARWDMFFARTGITPIEILYEDVAIDAQAAIDVVAQAMDVARPVKVDPARLHLRVQRDDESRGWRERFVRECGDPNTMDSAELLARTL